MAQREPLVWAPDDLGGLDHGVDEDALAIRSSVRSMLADHVRPHLAQWYLSGSAPVRDLARELGRLGVLGMTIGGQGIVSQMTAIDAEHADALLEAYKEHNDGLHETLEAFARFVEAKDG